MPVSFTQFIVSLAVSSLLTIAGIGISYKQTHDQIASEGEESKRVHASTLLKDISVAVADVQDNLRAYEAMALQLELCLPKRPLQRCYSLPFEFDGVAAQKAWRDLDGSIESAKPFLESDTEVQSLKALQALKERHHVAVEALQPVNTPAKAQAVRKRTQETIEGLGRAQSQLTGAVVKQVRSTR